MTSTANDDFGSLLMQKDVLMEEVSATAAFICYRVKPRDPLPKEALRTEEIRNYLLATSPRQIDFEKISTELEALKQPYLDKPILLIK